MNDKFDMGQKLFGLLESVQGFSQRGVIAAVMWRWELTSTERGVDNASDGGVQGW